jgi:BolA family transcriptional regulator, general stress-responsive regulator
MSIEETLREKIESHLTPTHLLVVNDSHGHSRGNETHFTVVVISSKFEGVSRLDRSRMVSELLDEERARGLHALTPKTFTPAEWDKIKDSFEYDPPACRGGGQ